MDYSTVKVVSEIEELDIEVNPDKTKLYGVKEKVSRLIFVDVNNLTLGFKGKVYPDGKPLKNLPGGFVEGMVFRLDFNRTELAREQTFRYAKRKGFVTDTFLTLKEQLFAQEEEWADWEERKLPPVPESAPIEPRKGIIDKIRDKISPQLTPGEKMLKARVKQRAKDIEKGLERAYLEIPGFYADSGLLFVNIEVNGVEVKACVDSGAGISVMLASCAEKCNLAHLIDERQGGMVTGMGTTLNLGRINRTSFKLGSLEANYHISVVLTGSTELLLGLDFIKTFGLKINLMDNCLELPGDEKIEFLPFDEHPERIDNTPVLESLVKMFEENE